MSTFEKVWNVAKWTCYGITMFTVLNCGFDAMFRYFLNRSENS